MDTPQQTQQLLSSLGDSVWSFATVAAAAESGLLEALAEPRELADLSARAGLSTELTRRLLDVLMALGLARVQGEAFVAAPGLLPLLQPPARELLLASVRANYLQSRDIIDRARTRTLAPGWHYTDPAFLHSQGIASGIGISRGITRLLPQMDGLGARLGVPGAFFLDVGAGIGAIAIAMCQLFPHVHVVGLEPASAPRAEARLMITESGMGDRIEMRPQGVEELADEAVFDLAWLPQVFLPREIFTRGLGTVYRALRPGGWLIVPSASVAGPDVHASLTRLRNVLHGGEPLVAETIATRLQEAGYTGVRVLSQPAGDAPGIVIGQRPLQGA